MSRTSHALPDELSSALRRQAQRRLLVRVVQRLATALLLGLGLLLLSLTVDRLVELPRLLRPLLPLATAGAPFALLVVTLVQLCRREDAERLAAAADAALPDARDAVRSAVNLSGRSERVPDTVNRFFLAATLARATARLRTLTPAQVSPWGAAPWRLALAGGLLCVLTAAWLWPPACMDILLRRFLRPLGNHPRPSLTRLLVDAPLAQTVAQGHDVAVAATLGGRSAGSPERCLLLLERDGRGETVLMSPRPGRRFVTVLKAVDRPFAFHVAAGDGRSALFRVDVQPRPELLALKVRYDYPRYTRLPRQEEELRYRELKAVAGTRVRLEFESSLPVRDGFAQFPGRRYDVHWDRERRHGSVQFVIETDGSFQLQLTAESGTDNQGDSPFRVRVIPDNPPSVSLPDLPEHLVFYREDVLPLHYRGSDDFGIDEVFVRYRSGSDRTFRTWSLDLPRANMKDVAGQASLDLRQLAGEEDGRVELELVMVDTKGQEAATPRVELQIISETPDRQLSELAGYEAVCLARLDSVAAELQAQVGRLDILLEGMEAATPLDGKRREMFDAVARVLGGIALDDVTGGDHRYRAFPFAEYPWLSQRQAEDAMLQPLLLAGGGDYAALVEAVVREPAPRQALVALQARVKAQAEAAQRLATALAAVLLETRLRVVDCVTEQYLRTAARESAAPAAGETAMLVAATQQERLGRVLAEWQAIGKRHAAMLGAEAPALVQALAAVETAGAQPAETRAAALQPALVDLRRELGEGPALDGRLGRPLLAWLQANPLTDNLRQDADAATRQRAARVLFALLRLRRDNAPVTSAELLPLARLQEALLTGDAGRVQAAVAASQGTAKAVAHNALRDRARLLELHTRGLILDCGVGRVRVESAGFDRRWQELREQYLALAADTRAGRLAGLGADPELGALLAAAPLFRPWTAATALGDERQRAELEKVLALLARLAATQTAPCEAVQPVLQAEVDQLLTDLLRVLVAEQERLSREGGEITAETESATRHREFRGKVLTESEWRARIGGRPQPARQAFARALCDRTLTHATAFQVAADLRGQPWFTRPAAERHPVRAAAVLAEYLAHAEEDTYEKSLQPFLLQDTQGARPYPEFLVAVGEYYAVLRPSLARLATRLQDWSAGRTPRLLDDPEFVAGLQPLRRQTRFKAADEATRLHGESLAAFDAATGADARRRAFRLLLLGSEAPYAGWEQIAWRLDELIRAAAPSAEAPNPSAWAGLDAALRQRLDGSGGDLRSLLPDAAEAPPEARPLPELLDELAALLARSAGDRAAALPGDERALLVDDWKDWTGRALAARRGLDLQLALPAVDTRPRLRYTAKFRMDLMWVESLLIRGETRWTLRLADEHRLVWSCRAWALAGGSAAPPREALVWQGWHEEVTRRRTAASLAQGARALQGDLGGVDERFLRMPKHLYEELLRSSQKPYPTDFRDTGTEYIRNLLRDAR